MNAVSDDSGSHHHSIMFRPVQCSWLPSDHRHGRADEYQRAAKSLRDFLLAFDQLMLDFEWTLGDGIFSRWKPKHGRRLHAERLASELARLARPAAEAFDASGVWIDYTPPGTWQTKPVNPALTWSTSFVTVVGGEPPRV